MSKGNGIPGVRQANAETATGRIYVARDVLTDCKSAEATALTRWVLRFFMDNPNLASLPIIEPVSRRPIGLINRAIFMSNMAKPFYREIYLDRSCLVFMDKEPLIVEEDTPLHEVSVRIAHAGEKAIADGFLIVSGGRYAGIGQTRDVLHTMAHAYRRQPCSQIEHRDNLERIARQRMPVLSVARDATGQDAVVHADAGRCSRIVPAQPEALTQLRQRHSGRRILVVEDDPVSNDIVRRLLSVARIDVDFVANGSDAVTRASERQVALILMGLQMPVMDGLTATRVIRSMRFGQRLPIIALAANALAEDRERCLASGMDDLLAKPIVADAFYECLLHWLERRSPASSSKFNRDIAVA